MLEIQFQSEKEAQKLWEIINKTLKYTGTIKLERRGENEFYLMTELTFNSPIVKKSLADFILQIKTDEWATEILINQYYFRDELELRSILEILHSIIEEEREGFTSITKDINLKDCLRDTMHDFIEEELSRFSFDSYVTFRLKPFFNKLTKYIELAIDEYKMEQDYQVFIDTLRNSVLEKKPKIQHIHVLIDLEIQFFDADYREITQQELMMLHEQRRYADNPFYIDPYTLGPLLALAPKNIYLYTGDREQAIVRTICNIFEERVTLMEKEDFFLRVTQKQP
ncbi:MAG TPA: putative sporulation protein YtxC [Niallia sp.]|nr:putative sporulation protein YtxC [Niallia sp.]